MGLDMYFKAVKDSFKCYDKHDDGQPDETNYPEDLTMLADYIYERNFKSTATSTAYQIGYFRKFNALHQFIVDKFANGVDECQDIFLTKERIGILKDICKDIVEDHSKAEDLLPTAEGFFFGGTEYDEWYFTNVEEAVKLFNMILDTVDFAKYRVVYQASW